MTINIQNLEETGTVTLPAVQPQVDTSLTATLEDDDGLIGTEWQWYRTSSRGSTGTTITNATSRFYTPGYDDVGSYLWVVATDDDSLSAGKTAGAVTDHRVQAAPVQNSPPRFPRPHGRIEHPREHAAESEHRRAGECHQRQQ